MKMKNILHLVAFALAFSVSVSFALVVKSFQGLSTPERITKVITEDVDNGFNYQNKYSGNITSSAIRTNNYVSASESINTEGLPEDFQVAWQRHMKAWRIHSNYLNEKKYSSGYNLEYDRTGSSQIEEINLTWYEVLRIARQHGAKIPAKAYY